MTQRIDSLFDGYKPGHENRWEMEREFQEKTVEMESRLVRLKVRAG